MRIVFEGTKEQMSNLKDVFESAELNHYQKGDLPKLREDLQIENLWCVDDLSNYVDADGNNCDEGLALEILESALTNGATMSQIWYAIDVHAEDEGFKKKEAEDG